MKLTLKGCTKVEIPSNSDYLNSISPEQYEINLGNRAQGTPPFTWEIVLQNPNSEPINYLIYSIQDSDINWISLGKTEGTLLPYPQKDSTHNIPITFFTEKREILSTHLIIENLSNPLDLKCIRVNMEV